MEAISVPVHIIPIPSRNPSATRGREGEEIKKKEKERRDHVFHSPVAWLISQPVLLAFFFLSILSPTFGTKNWRAHYPFYVRWISVRISVRRGCFRARGNRKHVLPPPLDIAIHNQGGPEYSFSSVRHGPRAYGFVHGSCQFVTWRNAEIVSYLEELRRWLTWQPSQERHWMSRKRWKVGDLFDSIVFPCFEYVVFRSVDDLNRIWTWEDFKT